MSLPNADILINISLINKGIKKAAYMNRQLFFLKLTVLDLRFADKYLKLKQKQAALFLCFIHKE